MVGSGMQQARRVVEEQAVAVVGNHEDGTRRTGGTVIPKSGHGDVAWRERTPGLGRRRGDLGQPEERRLGEQSLSRQDLDASGRTASKVRRANVRLRE